jgi:AcrR family transcriptional regulator
MSRPKEFAVEEALDAAIDVFREHGFEGTSTQMLVQAVAIGRQSLYDTFGDKWHLYLSAVRRYSARESHAHLAALAQGPRAIDGLTAMVDRVVQEAARACLGVGSICEFGASREELAQIHAAAGRVIREAIVRRVREAQSEGDVSDDLDPAEVADFLLSSFAGIRISARGGASRKHLSSLGKLALRALT